MEETLRRFEGELNALLSHLTAAERKKLARIMGQNLRRSQFARIRAQKNPDGSAFKPRKKGFIAQRRELTLLMDSEILQLSRAQKSGSTITGIDVKRGRKRTVKLADIKIFLASKKTKITTKRLAHEQRMFRKLATARFLRLKTDSKGAMLTFLPTAYRIAAIHHFGLTETYHGKPVHYPARQLLGLTPQDIIEMENTILTFLTR